MPLRFTYPSDESQKKVIVVEFYRASAMPHIGKLVLATCVVSDSTL